MTEPTRTEDAKNVSIITGAGLLGLVCTVAPFANTGPHQHRSCSSGPAELSTAAPAPLVERIDAPAQDSRLYGNVTTRSGEEFEGYIRRDRNEGSWADLLDVDQKGEGTALHLGWHQVWPHRAHGDAELARGHVHPQVRSGATSR